MAKVFISARAISLRNNHSGSFRCFPFVLWLIQNWEGSCHIEHSIDLLMDHVLHQLRTVKIFPSSRHFFLFWYSDIFFLSVLRAIFLHHCFVIEWLAIILFVITDLVQFQLCCCCGYQIVKITLISSKFIFSHFITLSGNLLLYIGSLQINLRFRPLIKKDFYLFHLTNRYFYQQIYQWNFQKSFLSTSLLHYTF